MTEPTDAEVEAAARAICTLAGHDPAAIGDPPSDDGAAMLAHAFPRWMSWRRVARAALTAAAQVRERAEGGEASQLRSALDHARDVMSGFRLRSEGEKIARMNEVNSINALLAGLIAIYGSTDVTGERKEEG